MGWIWFFGAWALVLVVFLVGNKRWHDRMKKFDGERE